MTGVPQEWKDFVGDNAQFIDSSKINPRLLVKLDPKMKSMKFLLLFS